MGGIDLSRLHPDSKKPDMNDYIRQFAAKFGVWDMIHTTRIPNTRHGLAMAEFARDQGKLDAFRILTLDAYWKEGRDIEDDKVLQNIAATSGLSPEKALLATTDPIYLGRVMATRTEYKQIGVGGIPTFVFGSEIIEGCQPYEVLVEAVLRAGARPRTAVP